MLRGVERLDGGHHPLLRAGRNRPHVPGSVAGSRGPGLAQGAAGRAHRPQKPGPSPGARPLSRAGAAATAGSAPTGGRVPAVVGRDGPLAGPALAWARAGAQLADQPPSPALQVRMGPFTPEQRSPTYVTGQLQVGPGCPNIPGLHRSLRYRVPLAPAAPRPTGDLQERCKSRPIGRSVNVTPKPLLDRRSFLTRAAALGARATGVAATPAWARGRRSAARPCRLPSPERRSAATSPGWSSSAPG